LRGWLSRQHSWLKPSRLACRLREMERSWKHEETLYWHWNCESWHKPWKLWWMLPHRWVRACWRLHMIWIYRSLKTKHHWTRHLAKSPVSLNSEQKLRSTWRRQIW